MERTACLSDGASYVLGVGFFTAIASSTVIQIYEEQWESYTHVNLY